MYDEDKIIENMIRLKNYSEWSFFKEHIKNNIQNHKDLSVNFLTRDNLKDAQRQAWICEGLMEAINEPDHVMQLQKGHKDTIFSAAKNFVKDKLKNFALNGKY